MKMTMDDIPEYASQGIAFSRDNVNEAIKKGPKESSPGNTGLTFEIVKILWNGNSGPCADSLWNLVSFLSLGNGPDDQDRPYFYGSALIALEKPGEEYDVRPIAMGEVIEKIVSSAQMIAIADEAATLFARMGQFSIGFSGGADFAFKSVVLDMMMDPSAVLYKLDGKNAFNSISRDAIADALKKWFPKLLPWFLVRHAQKTRLVFRLDTGKIHYIWSDEGSHQGDNAAMFYFVAALALGSEVFEQELKNREEESQLSSDYADDQNKVAARTLGDAFYDIAEDTYKEYGFYLKYSKCKVFDPRGQVSIRRKEAVQTEGTEVLGGLHGSDDFIKAELEEKITKIEAVLTKIEGLCTRFQDPQTALQFLRFCITSRWTPLTRVIDPKIMMPFSERVDDMVRQALGRILGQPIPPDSAAWKQARLRLNDGGLGLTSAVLSTKIAYAASWISFFSNANKLDADRTKLYRELFKESDSPLVLSLLKTTNYLHEELKYTNYDLLRPDLIKDAPQHLQHKLYNRVIKKEAKLLMSDSSPHDRARLLSVKQPESSAWLKCIPSEPRLTLPAEDFRDNVLINLGLLPTHIPIGGKCPCGEIQTVEHMTICKIGGGGIKVHDALVGIFVDMLRDCGDRAYSEPRNLFFEDTGTISNKKPDIRVLNAGPQRQDLLLDVSRICPTRPGLVNLREGSATRPRYAAYQRHREKNKKFLDKASEVRMWFLPLAFETFGAMHPKAIQFLEDQCKRITNYVPVNWAAQHAHVYWLQVIQVRHRYEYTQSLRKLSGKRITT
jgi:hypothetical protein